MKIMRAALFGLTTALSFAALGCGGTAREVDVYRDDTSKLLQTANEGISNCYTAILRTNPAASGSVTVKFTVAPKTGKFRRLKVDEARSTAPAPVQECVKQYISDLVLTPPDDQAGVASFTWSFVSKVVPAAPDASPPATPGVPPVAADPAKPPS